MSSGYFDDLYEANLTIDCFEASMAESCITYDAKSMTKNGDDYFDSLEWNISLPVANVPDSPEPLTTTPQKLTYTTVGSLVDPNSTPRFTAPNRAQRDWSVPGRKSYGSSSTHHSQESYYCSRGSIQLHPRNMQLLPTAATPTKQVGKSDYSLAGNREQRGRSGTGNLGSLTLDPTVEYGDNLFSSFKYHAQDQNPTLDIDYNIGSHHPNIDNRSLVTFRQLASKMANDHNINTAKDDAENHGIALDRSHIHEPSLLPSKNTSFPPTVSLKVSGDLSDFNTVKIAPGKRASGCPQPLTAGPPGRRQSARSKSHSLLYTASDVQFISVVKNNDKHSSQDVVDPLSALGIMDNRRVMDTLPIPRVSKYFPHGLPADMGGKFKALPASVQQQMDKAWHRDWKDFRGYDALKRQRQTDEWFYSGQRLLSRAIDDYNQIRQMPNIDQWKSINGLLRKSGGQSETPSNSGNFEVAAADYIAPLLYAALDTVLKYVHMVPPSTRNPGRLV